MVNRTRVFIAGAPYVIATSDPEEYVEQLAAELDGSIHEAMAANPSVSVTKAAVFCALDYLDRCKKSAGNADNMRSQITEYLSDAAKAKMEADQARREVERLKQEVQKLKEASDGR